MWSNRRLFVRKSLLGLGALALPIQGIRSLFGIAGVYNADHSQTIVLKVLDPSINNKESLLYAMNLFAEENGLFQYYDFLFRSRQNGNIISEKLDFDKKGFVKIRRIWKSHASLKSWLLSDERISLQENLKASDIFVIVSDSSTHKS